MRINHNIAALNTHRQLSTNMTQGSKSLEKLSSGLRINRAGDDAAGLAISEKMRAQIRGLNQAQRNAQDGISMIQTTEGALNESHSILQRMRELANQASNDTNVDVDREEIQKEIIQLTSEINRIGNTTEFNTQSLLKGKNVAVVETAAQLDTITNGAAGVAAGAVSSLTTGQKSVKAEASSASVQGSTSKATGAVSDLSETTESIKGVKAGVNLSVGLTVTAGQFGTDLNGKEVTVRQGTVAGDASKLEVDGQGNYIFTVGQTAGGASRASNLGTLYNEMNSAIQAYDNTTGFTASNKISVVEPPSQNTSQPVVLSAAGETGSLAGGVTERSGVYEFSVSNVFEEAGDSVTIGGQKFTAVLSGADAAKGEFNIGNIEASLTGGQVATAANLSGGSGAAKVDISIGGTVYTIAAADVNQDFTGGGTAAMKTAIEGATNASGGALSAVADVAIGTDGKISITAKNPQTQPITWTAGGSAADKKGINDAFGLNTTAQITGTGAVNTSTNLSGTSAVWTSGTIAGQNDTQSNTVTFKGVTVTIATAASAAAATAASDTAASVTLLNTGAAQTANATATALKAAFEAARDYNDGNTADNALAGFTFAVNASDQLVITGPATDDHNAVAAPVAAGTGALTFTGAAQTVAGLDAINGETSVSVTVDGKEFKINSNALKTEFDGSSSNATIQALIENAVDANGYRLADFADVAITAGNNVQITSKDGQPTSSVQFSINAGAAADVNAIQTAFGVTNFQSDTGADAVSSSRSAADQAKSLAAAIEANATLGARFEYASVSNTGTITLTETKNQAAGTAFSSISVAGSGANDKLLITNADGRNLNTITIARAQDRAAVKSAGTVQSNAETLKLESGNTGSQSTRANGVTVELKANGTDELNVSFKDGKLSINLANGTASKNTASSVQTAVRNLGTIDGVDFSTWTATGSTNWDTANTASDIEVASAAMAGGVAKVTENELGITVDNGNLTIHLSAESVKENTAAKIQAAVQDLGEYFYKDGEGNWNSIDFSKYTFEAQGNWDTNTLGNSIIKDSDTFVGGTEAAEGQYSFNVTTAFAAGDKVELNGQVFTAVDGVASAAKGEFSVSGGVLKDQAASLMTAANLNGALSGKYTASVNDTTITLTEKVATGTDLQSSALAVRATGTAGEYTVDQDALLENGAKFILDGKEILVTNKNQHVGYANGTAVKTAETIADQSKALADAINSNADLKNKYVASVGADGALKLTQTENFTSSTAPQVSTKNSSIGDFQATFQIGANSGQSMTVTVGDMRANALEISGDGSVGTVKASNGAVASYTAVSNVNSGSDNKNIEYALDVTTSEKASAALSVINDAIEKVSAQRSQLGAFQNRLEHTINNLGTSSENLVAAESRIRDVDMASEMMGFTKNNILSQAAQAMLAQANQLPQGVLQLLR